METVIAVAGIKLVLGGKEIINNLDLVVYKGELVFLAGRNGSGKSSLLNTIVGRYGVSAGTISVSGQIAYQEQKPIYLADMTVIENLACFRNLFRSSISNPKLDTLLARVGLSTARNTNTSRLSGGEKQRLSLAITLLRDRCLYLFDEADSAMDPIGRGDYFNLLMQLKGEGRTVLWISHHIKESLSVADRCYFLAQGRAFGFTGQQLGEVASNYSEDAFALLCEERLVKY